jgi:general stress protein 26
MILSGQLTWDEDVMKGKWFYQSENDPDLILLRSWVENKNN